MIEKKNALTRDELVNCLTTFSQILTGLEHFVFFGTLLGLTRDNAPIDGDDDVDFYVNIEHYQELKTRLSQLGCFHVDYDSWPNLTPDFIQCEGILGHRRYRADFYFYNSQTEPHVIVEKWNFLGSVDQVDSHLRTPKPFIYPISERATEFGTINIPKYPELVCEYLYGLNCKRPLIKDIEYIARTHGGRPTRLQITPDGSIAGLLP
jgi:hypothetical protein